MRTVVVGAAHRLADLRYDDDPNGAASAAEDGLRLEPTSLLLWRDVLRAESAQEGVAGVRRAVDRMGEVLEAHRVRLDPETEALVEELLPGPHSLPASG